MTGGEGGIRTPGTRKRTIDFESTALDHSATSPKLVVTLNNLLKHIQNKTKKYRSIPSIHTAFRFTVLKLNQVKKEIMLTPGKN